MVSFTTDKELRLYNTFHLKVYCRYFSEISSEDDFNLLLNDKIYRENPRLVLGGGSNVLFTDNYHGLVIKNNFRGLQKVREDEQHVYVKVGAGENWHQFVLYCIDENLGGLENLSLIPGNVGASPMQNIGAYGVEIKDVFEELEAIEMETGTKVLFGKSDCEFGYRESVFKRKFKNKFLISSVTYRLDKMHRLNTTYGAIEQELQKAGIKDISIRAISDAVIRIRRSKLPDPDVLGNAGSFFKNPEISGTKMRALKNEFPDIVFYPLEGGTFKLAAGWLIEQAGWKGKRIGDAGVHAQQALVLVNYGNASGKQIYDLSSRVLESVNDKFGVRLEREVNIVP
jgi:UDP-N-acetylmuramate dehydrogenase